jgi:hypothetical protein
MYDLVGQVNTIEGLVGAIAVYLWKSFLLLEKRYIFSRLDSDSSSKHRSRALSSTGISAGYTESEPAPATANGVRGPGCSGGGGPARSSKEPGSNVG